MDDPPVLVEQTQAVTTLILNRPEQRNAIDSQGWVNIRREIERENARPCCRVIVIRGSSGNFGAGANIAEFKDAFVTSESTLSYFAEMEAALRSIEGSPKPVVAVIEGLCIGACVALALACDIRLTSDMATFAITPAKLGIAYPYEDIARLVRTIGPGQARRLLYTGLRLTADEAMTIGLVDQLVSSSALEGALDTLTDDLSGASHFTIRTSKTAIRAIIGGEGATAAGYPMKMVEAVRGPDFMEGLSAFHEKRRPAFKQSTPATDASGTDFGNRP